MTRKNNFAVLFTTETRDTFGSGKGKKTFDSLSTARVVFITRHEEDWTDGALVDLRQPVWQPPASPAPSRRDSWC